MSKFREYDKYEVYEDGRIFSYKKNKFLKPRKNKSGYLQVLLYDNEGKRKTYLVHRVVWESVTGEQIPKSMQINHRNEIKTDNRFFENLELVTPKQNCKWGTRNQRIGKAVGAFKNDELVMSFYSTREAERNGFNKGYVSKCCRNCYLREGNNVYKGYEWRYL